MRYVALLRGINVSPRTQIAMADLRALLEGLGYGDVRTHLRSGNALFTAGADDPAGIAGRIRRRCAEKLGVGPAVILRTVPELRAVVEENPLEIRDPARFMVAFQAEVPDRGVVDGIDPALYAPEEVAIGRRELYMYFPDGLRRTKLPALLEERSGVLATMRNWNTVTRLLELGEGP
ncbi:hypothetical protein Skr01_37410 [Sphaerisporangium krabiense]|uniref:Uncharacterized protein (DUF1697 family) n=1 Tax=Sphaerisporangium krabiense TaxID=763782 RepID=A0A7W9DPQ2_9ACTN|nr:DUF1697 domain-containing protein [Sphaerisporangium krabiense]MBB5626737.1 uncharacterized protein (DUF1697 family) [Sphaerisporangium krabiense]GII63656.1 hypothetical protein Skr01_37410 [Sphaerisporangium krabiense]